jgi:hypothetical protein
MYKVHKEERMQERDKKGKFERVWNAEAKVVYLPFSVKIKAIAAIADKHPHPEKFLESVTRVARVLAIADGVEI